MTEFNDYDSSSDSSYCKWDQKSIASSHWDCYSDPGEQVFEQVFEDCPDCGLIEYACACEEEKAKDFVSVDDQLARDKARRDAKFQEDRKLHGIARRRALQSHLDSTRKQQVEQDKRIVRGGVQREPLGKPHHRAKRIIKRSKHVSDVLIC